MGWIVLLVLATGLVAPLAIRRLGERAAPALAVVPAGVAAWAAAGQAAIARGEIPAWRTPWIPSLDVAWAFRVDGLANLLVLLVAGIGALVVLYAAAYLRGHAQLGRFFAFLFVFMAGMLGIAAADDVLLLFVFWELTTVSSFLLIGFDAHRQASRDAARQSLIVTVAGGLALLVGLLLLVDAAGTSSLSEILRSDVVRSHPHYPFILAGIAVGAFTKSAQWPFHFWLPGAMQAPTPVSAYLHSSTMVKAGVFLLARLSPVLGGTDAWQVTLVGVGGITMLLGAVMALGQDDLKRLLAGSTISVLGLLTMLLGLGTPIAARAFAVTLLAHALYKGTLFLVAGNVDKATGTRSLERLGGLRGAMPWTAGAAAVAALSMAGGPPLFGFLAKETAYEAALEAPHASWLVGTATVLTGVCLVFAALRVGLQPFYGAARPTERTPRDPAPAMRLGPVVLAGAGVLTGLLVGPAERLLVAPAASAILQQEAPTGLALWHGFTPILALSALTLALGAGLFRARDALLSRAPALAPLARMGPARAYTAGLDGLLRFAAWQTRTLQNGSLRRYLAITLGAALVTVLAALGRTPLDRAWNALALPSEGPALVGLALAATLLVVGGALLAARAATRLVAVASLGAVGFGVALFFLVYSAPDLALTQLVIEVLTVVLLLLVLPHLPRAKDGAPRSPGAARTGLALLGGLTMAALALVASAPPLAEPISDYFSAQSVPAAHGRNVVNVILVDFRALDTLGEITVLGVAALGILALLATHRRGEPAP